MSKESGKAAESAAGAALRMARAELLLLLLFLSISFYIYDGSAKICIANPILKG
ncbi:MAG: hypothetical protein NC121_10125 [Blautia sp.]|nr:hypothetical protein [Blautia sp.]